MEAIRSTFSKWQDDLEEGVEQFNQECDNQIDSIRSRFGLAEPEKSENSPMPTTPPKQNSSTITAVKTTTKAPPTRLKRPHVKEEMQTGSQTINYHIPRPNLQGEDIIPITIPQHPGENLDANGDSSVIYVSDNFLFRANIFQYKLGSPVLYYMKVEVIRPVENLVMAQWVIKKRYSEMESCNAALLKRFGKELIPDFPPKVWSNMLYGATDDQAKERMTSLNGYFQKLLTRPQVCAAREIQDLFAVELPEPASLFKVLSFGLCQDNENAYAVCEIGEEQREPLSNSPKTDPLGANAKIRTPPKNYKKDPKMSPRTGDRGQTIVKHHGREKEKIIKKRRTVKKAKSGKPLTHFSILIRKVVSIGFSSESLTFVREDMIENTGHVQRFHLLLGKCADTYDLTVTTCNYRGKNETKTLQMRLIAPTVEDLQNPEGLKQQEIEVKRETSESSESTDAKAHKEAKSRSSAKSKSRSPAKEVPDASPLDFDEDDDIMVARPAERNESATNVGAAILENEKEEKRNKTKNKNNSNSSSTDSSESDDSDDSSNNSSEEEKKKSKSKTKTNESNTATPSYTGEPTTALSSNESNKTSTIEIKNEGFGAPRMSNNSSGGFVCYDSDDDDDDIENIVATRR